MKRKVLDGKQFVLFVASVAFLAATAFAGNVCTWTGGAGDGKWSSTGNWEGGVVPGGDDIVWLSGANTATISNDVEDLSVNRVYFTNSVPVTLTGGKITLTGDSTVKTVWSNDCPVVCYAPLEIGTSSSTSALNMMLENSVTISNDVTSSSTKSVYFQMWLTRKNYNLHIYGSVNMPSATVYFQACNTRGIYLHGPVTAAKIAGNGSAPSNSGICYLYQPATYGTLEIAYRNITCEAENVLCPTAPVLWVGNQTAGRLNLNGHDQTCDLLGGVYKNGANVPNEDGRTLDSESPATLTVRATQSSNTYVIVKGNASILYAPVDSSLVQTFSTRTNTTEGALIVSNGTVRIDAGSLWQNLPEIQIWENGTLEISSTNGIANPFPALKTVYIQPGGKLKIPSGVALTAEMVLGLGFLVEDATYSQNKDEAQGIRSATWIEGDGTLTVTYVGPVTADWKQSSDGAWRDGANWVGGAAPSADLPARVLNHGADFTVSVTENAAASTNLTAFAIPAFGDPGETTFDVTALWPFERAWISFGAGTKVEVGNGGHFRYDGGEEAAAGDAIDDNRIVLKDGAQLTVKNGGTFTVTNAHGRVTVGGGSDDSTGTLKVEAGGLFDFSPGVKDIVVDVEKGGLVDVAGTMRLHRRNDNAANLLRMAGGEMRFSGDAFLDLHGDSDSIKGGYLQFGTGKTTFSDSACLQFTGSLNYYANMSVAPTANGETAELVFDGSSGISNSVQNLYICNRSEALDGTSTMTMKKGSYWGYSTSSMRMANHVIVGYLKGKGTLNVAGATLRPGMSGIRAGYIASTRTDRDTEGEINLSDGALMTVYATAAYSRSSVSKPSLDNLYGTTVGCWITAKSGVTGRPAVGRINITGDTTTLNALQGHVIVGAGAADGTILMDGKELTVVKDNTYSAKNNDGGVEFTEYATNSVMAIGMLTGKGAFIQTAGSVLSNLRTYIGGCETNQYFDGWSITTDPCRIGQRTAEGLLCISNGTFAATKEVYVGTDGAGTIQVGPTGTFTAKTLVLSNQTSSVLRFVFGANGFSGGVTATNLVIASGAKLEVDASGYGGRKSTFKLLKAASVTGAFADRDITIATDGDSAGAHLEWRNGSLVFVNPRGITVILR